MTRPSRYIVLDDGVVVPTGATTTYRVVSDGTAAGDRADAQEPLPAPLWRWLRRQHPADVVRIVLMLIAVSVVVIATVRFG